MSKTARRPSISSGAKLPPLHVLPQLVPEVLVVDIGVAQRLLNKPDQVSRLLIGKAKGKPAPLASVVGDQLQRVEPTAETELERLTDSFHLNLTAFGLLSFFVGLFIVNSAVGLAFEQRLPMLRTLRACGASARLVNTVLVIELVALALVAGLIGLVCGYVIAAALLPDVAASLRGLYGAQIPGQLTLRPEWWLAGIGISVAGAMVAAATSLIKAIRMPVLATAQPYAWQQRQRRWLILQSLAACAVFAVALLLLQYGQSLIAGFGLLAALMLGAALILPAFLEILLLAGQRFARGPLALWFWADSRQQLSGLSLALMALLLALAVNVGVVHDGGNVQPHLCRLARWAARRRRLHQCRRQCARRRDPQLAEGPQRGAGDPVGRTRRDAGTGPAGGDCSACPITRSIASAGRCWKPRRAPGRSWCPAMPPSSASS